NCPACFEEPKERERVKKMLFKEESLNPEMYNSFRRALLPLMDNDVYPVMNDVRARIDSQKKVKSNVVKSTKAIAKEQAVAAVEPKPEPTADPN
ncbi:hypothetical protein SPRG_18041, partial [Saprolegnia parasitica CBS 223.65]